MDSIEIINWEKNLPKGFDVTDSVVKNDGEEGELLTDEEDSTDNESDSN